MTNPNPINEVSRAALGIPLGVASNAPMNAPLDSTIAAGRATVRTVAICDTQPVMAAGIRTLLDGNPELQFLETTDSLKGALERIEERMGLRPADGVGHEGRLPEGRLTDGTPPDVLLVDKAFGIQAILDWLARVRPAIDKCTRPGVVVWGVSISEAEALRFLQAGARGILRKTAPISVVLACLRTVAAGRSWMEDAVFRDMGRSDRYPRSELTAREQQVLELVEQGFKNKEIAQDLGIRPGTVKIHLKHIFEKTGVRGRYGLALNGLKERGVVSVPA
jgi:two-component system, NarL family, nitrate/nitrite response regulator NarL